MDDLIAFLAARLDEEEAAAKGPPGWRLEHWSAIRYAEKASGRDWRVDAEPRCIVDSAAKDDAGHIARYDPARAVREVEAKRAIVRRCEQQAGKASDNAMEEDRTLVLWPVLFDLAVVYSDHPDYRPAWEP